MKSGALTLEQNGAFTISLSGLKNGNYTAVVSVQDVAENPKQGKTLKFEKANSASVDRISGDNRYETAIEISKDGWSAASTVILSRGDNFADALAGVPLAYKLDAPILMTSSAKLSANVLKEIQRLGAKNVVILGRSGAVSKNVETELKSAKLNVRRISGNDRFGTAALIANEVAPNGTNNIVVANGMDFPDALSAASYSATQGIPILLTSANKLSEPTSQAVKN
ncbi:cell wall-binding repeat-containing protein [Oceanobacillus alkalisoli]|uniref:cell wall-binding repeat-containing protein n=1 Tax=Oceanobacillus alkalisoli TaxID=2925113 RepID=UPI001F11C686|nr:cell wall-binding repeat-containing protein [Oceanobacillus alkalisoli]MCF3943156.1 cell wall-binding repeat-containing protein [Oceanobacillus alkalisoli]